MPRTKGSKNRPKTVTADFATQIAEKQSAKEALTAEIASITANIDTLKADLKEKKTALKKTEKEVVSLEAKKAKADAKAAEEAKKTEAEAVLKDLYFLFHYCYCSVPVLQFRLLVNFPPGLSLKK